MLLGSVIELRLSQFQKQSLPNDVILLGSVIELRLLQ